MVGKPGGISRQDRKSFQVLSGYRPKEPSVCRRRARLIEQSSPGGEHVRRDEHHACGMGATIPPPFLELNTGNRTNTIMNEGSVSSLGVKQLGDLQKVQRRRLAINMDA